jgi:hypothetical protein
MGQNPDDRIGVLERALAAIADEARSARMALCAHELEVRLENIARLAEAALDAAGDPNAVDHQNDGSQKIEGR